MFDEKIEGLKILFGTSIAFIIKHTGGSYKHIFVLLVLMLVDSVFGWVKGKKLGNWKSSIARWGAVGKIAELLLIGLLYCLDWLFNINILKYAGIYYFGLCEIASVFENYAEINGNLPEGATDLLKKLQANYGSYVVKQVKEMLKKWIGDEK